MAKWIRPTPMAVLALLIGALGTLIGGGLLVSCLLNIHEWKTSGGDAWVLIFLSSLGATVLGGFTLLGTLLTLRSRTARFGAWFLIGYPFVLFAVLALFFHGVLEFFFTFAPLILPTFFVGYQALRRSPSC